MLSFRHLSIFALYRGWMDRLTNGKRWTLGRLVVWRLVLQMEQVRDKRPGNQQITGNAIPVLRFGCAGTRESEEYRFS